MYKKRFFWNIVFLFVGIGSMFILERVFFPQPNVYIEIEGSVTPPFPLPTTRHSAISENERQMRDVISAAPIISVYDGLEIDFQSTGTLGQDNFRHMEANFLFDLDDFFSGEAMSPQALLFVFTGTRMSLLDISLYNPKFFLTKNPYQKISVQSPKTFWRMLEGDFCVAFTIEQYLSPESLKSIGDCHLITFPEFSAPYPSITMFLATSTLSPNQSSSLKVAYREMK